MSDYEAWLAANDRFLAEAMAWLRARLERLARDVEPAPGPPTRTPTPASRPSWGRGRKLSQDVATTSRPGTPDRTEPEALPPAVAEAETLEEPPPLVLLARRLGLSTFERNVLLLAVAMELDTRIPRLCARAQHDPEAPYPTFALALTVFDEPSWDVMSPERPLRHWELVEVIRPRSEPLTVSRLRADDRVVSYVKGLNYLDERLRPMLRPVPAPTGPDLSASQLDAARSIVAAVHRAAADARAPSVQLLGGDAAAKRLLAAQAAADLGLHLLELSAEDLPGAGADLDVFARLWHRESLLSPVGLLLDAADVDKHGPVVGAVRRWLSAGAGLMLLDVREPWPGVGDGSIVMEVARPTPAEQRRTWQDALGDDAGTAPELLAGQFDFNLPVIRRLVRDTTGPEAAEADESTGLLWQACLAESRPSLDQLAQRLEAKATWDDIVLPPTEEQPAAADRRPGGAPRRGLRRLGLPATG